MKELNKPGINNKIFKIKLNKRWGDPPLILTMKEQIKEFLGRYLYYKGRGANNGVWESWEGKGEDAELNAPFRKLAKPHSWKTLAKIRVYYFINEYPGIWSGHEIKIEMKLNSYLEWDSVFEGWVDDVDELILIFKTVGIPLNNES